MRLPTAGEVQTATAPEIADRNSRNASLTLAFAQPGDTLLYLLLPLHHPDFGISLAEAGLLLAANRLVLDTIDSRIEGELTESQVDGRVVIEPGARLERCAVRGPAVIGAGASLTDCYVGPYTAVGRGCTIENAEVEHSILLSGAVVRDLEGRMESSLLGRNVKVGLDRRPPRAYRFMVGDNSEVGIP